MRVSLRDSFNLDNNDPILSQLREKVMMKTASSDEKAEFHNKMEMVVDNIMRLSDYPLNTSVSS